MRRALADCEVKSGPGDPEIDPNWAEPGLTLAEKVFAWCTFEILAMESGVPASPVNAVPPRAWARGQIRFVVGTDPDEFLPALRRHLDRHGFPMVQIAQARDDVMMATRLDPEHPWARWAATSIAKTTNTKPAVLPNVGGSLPNDIFSDGLGLPTIWVPHSYPGCSQHAPNEHFPIALAREALGIMAGLYWDLGEPGTPARGQVDGADFLRLARLPEGAGRFRAHPHHAALGGLRNLARARRRRSRDRQHLRLSRLARRRSCSKRSAPRWPRTARSW